MAVDEAGEIGHDRVHEEIAATFTRLAARPDDRFDFNRGAMYAQQQLNYAAEDLAVAATNSVRRFAGVGNPHRIGPVEIGETVLDHGCGAGMDLIIAAHRTGPTGRVIGIDMTAGMLEHAWFGCVQAGVDNWCSLFNAHCENLPVDDASVDVAMSNGVLNYTRDRSAVLTELFRVLRPGGRLHLADVVLQAELPDAVRQDAALWAAGIGGAVTEDELREAVAMAGFVEAQVTERFDCYRHAPVEVRVPQHLRLGAINFFARKPGI